MSSSPSELDDLLYWTGDQITPADFDEDAFDEDGQEEDVVDDSKLEGKGKRESMYISVFESQFPILPRFIVIYQVRF
jgi:hypothetical protein